MIRAIKIAWELGMVCGLLFGAAFTSPVWLPWLCFDWLKSRHEHRNYKDARGHYAGHPEVRA